MKPAELDGERTKASLGSNARDTRKRDDAPRGVFRPRPGLWAVLSGCQIVPEQSVRLSADAGSRHCSRAAELRLFHLAQAIDPYHRR